MKKKRGSSFNLGIHHSKVFSSGFIKGLELWIFMAQFKFKWTVYLIKNGEVGRGYFVVKHAFRDKSSWNSFFATAYIF